MLTHNQKLRTIELTEDTSNVIAGLEELMGELEDETSNDKTTLKMAKGFLEGAQKLMRYGTADFIKTAMKKFAEGESLPEGFPEYSGSGEDF